MVAVHAADGRFLGRGTYSPRGAIAVRLFVRADRPVDAALVHERVSAALALRRQAIAPDTTAYRLLNGEGDGLPGVVVDWYDGIAVAQFLTAGADRLAPLVDDALLTLCAPRGIWERSEGTVRREDGLRDRTGPRWGADPPQEVPIIEGDLRFLVDVRAGQKTGFYLDQRENRALVRALAGGRRVLNVFAYTGGFAVAAGVGGAARVVSVDTSPPALALARRNWETNGLAPSGADFVRADAFEFFRETREPVDLVILDPPAFARRRRDLDAAVRGYREVNRQAMLRLAPGGWLLTCSCSHHVAADTFRVAVMSAAAAARRPAQLVRRLGPGADHPVALAHPEGDYLKGLLVRMLE
jgi:23S rRNA (cytosine1962-C5)-methyltransferase